ncbi:MAG: GNAT family N-acetyltransferase [Victivallales bacterium]
MGRQCRRRNDLCAFRTSVFSGNALRAGDRFRIRKGRTAEIRLFTVRKEYRFTTLPARLAVPLLLELKSQGIENIIISAVESRRRLYCRLGFVTLGESVMDGASRFYPMAAELESLCRHCQCALRRYQ